MQRKTANEIREAFLSFFAEQDHARVASAPLVPQNDPTLLFTNAGMNQFKDVFTGREKRPYSRACSAQKCVRAGGKHNDLENVGLTARHHTFFEMLGNFSFGDYFKAEAIKYAWEFITSPRYLGLDPARLAVTVFAGEGKLPADTEAEELWRAQGVRPERIFRMGKKDNFWQMGNTGPCGPCSEIHIFRGDETDLSFIDRHAHDFFAAQTIADQDSWMELWNLVFMQFEMAPDGALAPLPKRSIDTGAGLERLAAVLQEVPSNYDTDGLRALIARVEQLSGLTYGATMSPNDVAMRVIADHARATAFLVADGVLPSNEGRGYVLRRIMRRAIRYGSRMGMQEPFFHEAALAVIEQMGAIYPELSAARSTIIEFARNEELSFRRTLGKGVKMLGETMDALEAKHQAEIAPETVFFLYDTHGFPADLTRVIAAERGFKVDEAAFEEFKSARQASGAFGGSGEKAIANIFHELQGELGDTEFLGYETLTATANLRALLVGGERAERAAEGSAVELFFDRTPFYGESGGQVGDTGRVDVGAATVEITNASRPVGGLIVHHGKVLRGSVARGATAELTVDAERRQAIRLNHSATHLLHHALRNILGEHVKQAGSKVAPEGLRFDYTHFSALTPEQVERIEEQVNAQVRANAERQTKISTVAQAREAGAMMLFGEKYGESVRMVGFGPSLELCGGTHVDRTGDIGAFLIASDESLASGVRRIWAVTGQEAIRRTQEQRRRIRALADSLKSSPELAPKALEKLQGQVSALEKELDKFRKQGAASSADELAASARDLNGIKVVSARIEPADAEAFRSLADKLRDKLKSALVVLGGEKDGKALLMVATTPDLVAKGLKAGDLIRELAKEVGGKGGGRPDLAQAGGPDVAKLEAALAKVFTLVS